MNNIENTQEIIENSFGLWITSLFSAISGLNPGIPFDHHKEAFFSLLKILLSQKRIRFCRPDDPLGEKYSHWEADDEEIIEYLHNHWPPTAINENDLILNQYFYDMPAILWVGENGLIYSS